MEAILLAGYLVIEHIRGSTLRAIVSHEGVLTEQQAIESALQMCDILEYLHSLSPPVVHRDSDIYAMGATLHFLLTGCDPEPLTTSHPRALNDSVSEQLDSIIARATSLYDVDRFADIQQLRDEISALNAGSTAISEQFEISA